MTETPQDQNQPETDKSAEPSPGRSFSLGRTGRRIAVGASIAVAFLGGMAVYGAVDDREVDADQASLVTSEDHDDDHYEEDERYERDDDDYMVPPAPSEAGNGNQAAPMQSGQS